jgi:RES domain-containing protein
MMLVYRIVHNLYAKNLFASGIKGRWNGSGKKVIYAVESIALAFLENMVRRQGVGFNNDFKIMIINVPDKIPIYEINVSKLTNEWRNFNDYSNCQSLGDKWYEAAKTPVLKVPSAVLPESFNYVINSEHADFRLIKLVATTDLVPDERIEAILKMYAKK